MHPGLALIQELKNGSPHLRIILPAAAALVWTIKRITGHAHEDQDNVETESEEEVLGQIVNVLLQPRKRSAAPRLPYKPPEPRSTLLLDILVPTTVDQFWKNIFQGDSNALDRYHRSMGDKEVYVGPWRQKEGVRRRRVSFIKPLRNPLGPRQATNQETFTITDMSPNGFTCSCVCKTSGVPFSSSFQNELTWVGYQVEDNVMRLIVSGECKFTEAVFGPLRGTISRESVSGMKKAYDQFFRQIVRDEFGILEDEHEDKKRGTLSTQRGMTDGVVNLAQANPAVLVALLATIVIIMRIITTRSLYSQLLNKAFASLH